MEGHLRRPGRGDDHRSRHGYVVTAKPHVRVIGALCELPSGRKTATFTEQSGSDDYYVGRHGYWKLADCAFSSWGDLTIVEQKSRLHQIIGSHENNLTRA